MIVMSNLAISLDGKIKAAGEKPFHLGSAADRRHMQILRGEADVVLIGGSTLRAWRKPLLTLAGRTQPANALLTRSLEEISHSWPFFSRAGLRRFLFAAPEAPATKLRRLEKSCEVIRLSRSSARRPTAVQVLDALEKRGFQRILVEGGGTVMWEFVHLNLIDEYHVTLTPQLIGGADLPTLVDGPGLVPDKIINLRLEQCRRVGEEIFLIYRRRS